MLHDNESSINFKFIFKKIEAGILFRKIYPNYFLPLYLPHYVFKYLPITKYLKALKACGIYNYSNANKIKKKDFFQMKYRALDHQLLTRFFSPEANISHRGGNYERSNERIKPSN